VKQIRSLTRSLTKAAKAGGQLTPIVMVDQEGGSVKRFASAAPKRSARSMSRLSESAIQRIGRSTARDLRARGVDVDLAPVADVKTKRRNFLGTRAFGGDPGGVASDACAFAAGLTAGGVGATLKHFPGLGAAGDVNSDDGSVTINASRAVIEAGWAPYTRCANEPNTLVMVSSAKYPKVYGSRQAVVNPAMYNDLRRKVGFDGVVVTDALNAVAVKRIRSLPTRAVAAGADLLLYLDERNAARATSALRRALAAGTITQDHVADSVHRVKRLRANLR
ncbi:MAG: glycoside hydrolase family 3 N-terminal domain-containing protein, partial [Solirubrobacterales bacterium]